MQLSLPIFDVIEDQNVEYNHIHRDKATFKSGVAKAVHGWFRLTPSFGPDLVRIVLEDFKYNEKSVILDPFSGASTTLIECQLINLKSYGFEINPMLYFAGKTALNWSLSVKTIRDLEKALFTSFKNNQKKFTNSFIEELPFTIPPIHNVYRWWREDVLKDLLILKHSIFEISSNLDNAYRDFLFLCLAGVLVPNLTNVTLGKLQLHFIDRTHDYIDVWNTYEKHLSNMISDFTMIKKLNTTNYAKLFLTDSTTLDNVKIEENIDIVITSPPYPNRYSYVWNTRPFLYFFDFFSKPKEASQLDKKTIGGTWGTATSILSKGCIEPVNDTVKKHVKPVSDKIRKNDNLMANYVLKYFNMLTTQIVRMDTFLTEKAKVAYVVGNSEIKGVFVETDIILSKIFKDIECNYKSTKINRFRKRNSGKNLFESIVFAEK